MKHHILVFTCLCSAAVVFVSAIPLPANDRELDVLQIPLDNGKEIDVLTLGTKEQEQLIAERNKRTVGLLRELFPDITKQIDEQVNMIVAKVLRAFGPTLLRTAIQGNTANQARSSFDADFDDDDDNSSSSSSSDVSSGGSSSGGSSGGSSSGGSTRVSVELPTFSPDDEDDNEIDSSTTESSRKRK